MLSFLRIGLLLLPLTLAAALADLDEEVRRIATELRCAVCQNLSVADSPSELAQQMRGVILDQIKEGKTPEQIKAYFVSKYGEWILLAPSPKGLSLVLWVLPFVALVGGMVGVVLISRRWTRKKNSQHRSQTDPTLLERVRREIASGIGPSAGIESLSRTPRNLLLQEKAGFYSELRELEFDREAGRLGDTDYSELRRELEERAASVLERLESMPTGEPPSKSDVKELSAQPTVALGGSHRRWHLVVAGAFLLLFGIALGTLLTKSLRPRGSEGDSITGDFLTGTGQGRGGEGPQPQPSQSLASLLAQGRDAFGRQEWPRAIDAFKKALVIDPNAPEAHAYMGLILSQAGHADGALLAFDRALARDANFPLALWGKGLVLFHLNKDYASARGTWEKLLATVPSGKERDNLEQLIGEAKRLEKTGAPQAGPSQANRGSETGRLSGTITVASSLKNKLAPSDTLFIIVRRGMGGEGPPAAVKKISSPRFPLKFSIGAQDSMVPGTTLEGKLSISVRVDKDGNPGTRTAGDLIGVYNKNPVEVGQSSIDIIIDQAL